MSKILKSVAAALMVLSADPCVGQPLTPAANSGSGASAARVLETSKESGTVVSRAMTLISILESAPAGSGYSGIIGPLSAGSAAGTLVASRTPVPGTGGLGMLVVIDGVAVAIATGTAAVSTAGTQ
jgi:hypothetical protein